MKYNFDEFLSLPTMSLIFPVTLNFKKSETSVLGGDNVSIHEHK